MEGRGERAGDLFIGCAFWEIHAEAWDLDYITRVRPGCERPLLQEPPEGHFDPRTESISVLGVSADSVERHMPYIYRDAPHRFTFA